MYKKILLLFLLIVFGVFIFLQFQRNSMPATTSGRMQVISSIYPVYYFASIIGGDKIDIRNLTPSGMEPHEYELTPKDIVSIEKSSILLLNGIVESWGGNIKRTLHGSSVLIVTTGEGLFSLRSEETGHTEDDGHSVEEHSSLLQDPHIWLDPMLAKKQSQKITEAFITKDPANAEYYKKNADVLYQRFDDLHNAYQSELQQCSTRDIITSHSAFGYLANAYNFRQVSIAGLSSETEPSTKQLAEVVQFARDHEIQYIFFEKLVSPKFSETIAREVGAETLVLDPVEGIPQDSTMQGENYFTIMEKNRINLQKALGCTR